MRNRGCALPLHHVKDRKSYYCANSITVGPSNEIACYAGSPFTLDRADLIWDKAALTNYTYGDTCSNSTSASNTTACPTAPPAPSSENRDAKDNNDLAIGAGVGIPLGVLLLTALGWALFERRKRLSVQATVAGLQSQAAATKQDMPGQAPVYSPPSELSAAGKPPQELATTSR
ncbi:hypothetical protein N7491_001564 [Penicillium cf. griseofulvum]|uniref:Uncharacterized protein n=1 Tax=Penicillium cf. griseofulvum TaxID=2972120 RepID=A0A9W9M9W4_9EURO|nr:hypothetical protein N7472_006694 [Penicillium cf. griseofulvum]KAJ5445482.1 hypothetical protein N7491_001564 [Penicillium cf. griseofulvum]KAJ5447202.1 hypothetical protein N7445_002023 [Penicillium cf. griseofulvum]